VVHFNVTEHPTAAWTVQQIVEAFPWDEAPRYLHGYQSATLYSLVVGRAALENVYVTFRPMSTSGVIRQQHHSINTPTLKVRRVWFVNGTA
jgi:hypothetical protein